MKGYPKTKNTYADWANLLAEEAYQSRAIADLQQILDERYGWQLVGRLDGGEAGNTSSGYRVEEIADDSGNVTERYQYAWGASTHALDRMGVTVADCVAWGCVDRVIDAPNT